MAFFDFDLANSWAEIVAQPGASIGIIFNLIIIESLLSVDNAAVLATMVMDLPPKERQKALKYGIWGAYIFRGLALIFASILLQYWWLKVVGGLYLLYLVFSWWKGKQTASKEDDLIDKKGNWFYRVTVGSLGAFWSTVVLVEIMDMAFSIDNVFAAVAFSPNIILIFIGVFIGILAMRFVANWFVKLMEKYTFLETAAFVVIAVLGLKLSLSIVEHYYPTSGIAMFLSGTDGKGNLINHTSEVILTLLTVGIFFVPIATSYFFNYPKRNEVSEVDESKTIEH